MALRSTERSGDYVIVENALTSTDEADQISEFFGGQNFVHVTGHQRSAGFATEFDRCGIHSDRLPVGIDEGDLFFRFIRHQANQDSTIVQQKTGGAKCSVDVSVGRDDIFEQPIDASSHRAIKLWPDDGSLATQLMTGGAVLGE